MINFRDADEAFDHLTITSLKILSDNQTIFVLYKD